MSRSGADALHRPGHGPDDLLALLRRHARPLTGAADDYDPLVAMLGEARLALLGEASHGTHDFYAERVRITQRLIVEHGYAAVAVEGDWPDAYRVDRYVRGLPGDADATAALGGFARFPAWMWRNTVVRDFVEWLRTHNAGLPPEARVGFYGMDLYSLFGSIAEVLRYLDRTDPAAALRARERYACFDRFGEDGLAYGHAASRDMGQACEDAVVAQLLELARNAGSSGGAYGSAGDPEPEARFHAAQNARLVRNAERYHRAMFRGRIVSWNLRDEHMVETLEALDTHLGLLRGAPPRIAVWAHNAHLGDASATELGDLGEWNVGQLLRERIGRRAVRVGFTTWGGSVTAAPAWDGPGRTETVRPGLPGSVEDLFHRVGAERFLLVLRDEPALEEALRAPLLQRAIGVVYAPRTERRSHYFHARLPQQFDAVVHLDATRALEPLPPVPGAGGPAETPEAYPSGL